MINDNNFKLHGSGFGMFFLIFISIMFWTFLLACLLFDKSLKLDLRSVMTVLGLTLFCTYLTAICIKFRISNYIIITEKSLFISVTDRNVRRSWPKFNTKTIELCDIESVFLNSPDISSDKLDVMSLSPKLEIRTKNKESYYIDTKPFSKAGFRKLFKEFEYYRIYVTSELGDI